jgi:hypothetical protein
VKKYKMLLKDIYNSKIPMENFLKLEIPMVVSWKFGKIAKLLLEVHESIENERGRTIKRFLLPEEDSLAHIPAKQAAPGMSKDELAKLHKRNEEIKELNADKDKRKQAFQTEFTNFLSTSHEELRFEPIYFSQHPELKELMFASSNMITLNPFFEE